MIASDLGLTPDGVRKITRRLQCKGRLQIIRPAHTAPGKHLEYRVILPPITQTDIGVNTQTDGGVNGENHPDSGAKITQTAVSNLSLTDRGALVPLFCQKCALGGVFFLTKRVLLVTRNGRWSV